MHYYILHTDTLSIPWRTIQFHVVLGLLVLIPVQFDSVDYYFRPTQNQVFHVKQKTSGRSFAMKVLHKVGYFGQNCFQQRWLISDEGCFLPKAFGILLAWGVISGCSNMNIWKAIPDFVLFFWSSVRDGFQLSDTFVIKIMALKVCWDMHSVKHIYIYTSWQLVVWRCWTLPFGSCFFHWPCVYWVYVLLGKTSQIGIKHGSVFEVT